MPTYIVGSRKAGGRDAKYGYKVGQKIPLLCTRKARGKYSPHIGEKEHQKFCKGN